MKERLGWRFTLLMTAILIGLWVVAAFFLSSPLPLDTSNFFTTFLTVISPTIYYITHYGGMVGIPIVIFVLILFTLNLDNTLE